MFIVVARTRLLSQEPAELFERERQLRLPPCLAEMGGGTAALVQLSEVLDGADHLRGVAVLARHRFGRCRRGEK